MRTFLAIDIPLKIKNNIYSFLLNSGFYNIENLTFVKKENFHITISFLGEQNADDLLSNLEFIRKKKVEYFSTHNNSCSIQGIGAFPNIKHCRIFWIGVRKVHKNIRDFSESIERILLKKKIINKITNNFHPHITIARNKKNKKINFQFDDTIFFGSFAIKNITLFSSQLTNNGPIYTEIVKY